MKLEKTASGSKKVTISKAEWIHIGKQAGWTGEGWGEEGGMAVEVNDGPVQEGSYCTLVKETPDMASKQWIDIFLYKETERFSGGWYEVSVYRFAATSPDDDDKVMLSTETFKFPHAVDAEKMASQIKAKGLEQGYKEWEP